MTTNYKISREVKLIPGMVLKLPHRVKGYSWKEEVDVIEVYPLFVVCRSAAGYRFAVSKSDIFFGNEVEW